VYEDVQSVPLGASALEKMVFAGASFGQGVVQMGGFGAAAKKSAAVKALQGAIHALGQAVGDKSLAITADGIIGPKTVAAVNRAFKTHLNAIVYNVVSGAAGMTSTQVASHASELTAAITDFLRSKGIKTAAASMKTTSAASKATTAKAPTKTAPTRVSKSVSVQRLQQAVRILGQQKGDKSLLIATDGLIGPKTVAAANRALQKYASEAPPEYRTGALTASQISTMADNLVPYLHQTADVAHAPSTSSARVPATAPKGKAAVAALQQALQSLGQNAGDSTLMAIAADGLVGPKTTSAVNRAFTQYIAAAYAPAQLRTGRLTNASVSTNAAKLADLVNRESVRRAGTASAPADDGGGEVPAESAATPGQVVAQQQLPAVPGTPAAAQAEQAEYMPPGTYTSTSSGGGSSAAKAAQAAAQASGDEAPDEGGGAMIPVDSTAVTTTSSGGWASLSTPTKVAVGAGAAVGGSLLLWGLVKLFSGGGTSQAARGAARYARR
jgi:lysozyme family protein